MPPLPNEVEELEENEISNYKTDEVVQTDLQYSKFASNVYNQNPMDREIKGYKYHEKLSDEAFAVYESEVDAETGYGELVFAFKGTDKASDLVTDMNLAFGSVSFGKPLLESYNEGYKKRINLVRALHPENKVKLVGHSLGSLYAKSIAVDDDYEAITFNPATGVFAPDIGREIKCAGDGCPKIHNYRLEGDIVSYRQQQSNIGTTETIPYDKSYGIFQSQHSITNFYDDL